MLLMRKIAAMLAVAVLLTGALGISTARADHPDAFVWTWHPFPLPQGTYLPMTACFDDTWTNVIPGAQRNVVSTVVHAGPPPATERVWNDGFASGQCELELAPSLPDGASGEAYEATLLVKAGDPAFTWTVDPGLPPGLTLDETTGVISGTPASAGMFTFDVTVANSYGPNPLDDARTYSIDISVNGPAVPEDEGDDDGGAGDGDCTPGVLTPTAGPGVTMTTWSCGGIGDLPGDAVSYWVTSGGSFEGYRVGAPDFANQGFLQLFGNGIPDGQLLLVVK